MGMEIILRCICGRGRRLRVESAIDGILKIPGNTSFLHFQNSFGKFVWLCPKCSIKTTSAPATDELEDDVAYIESLIKKVI